MTPEINQNNGWNEWGKHVLSELERLSVSIESLIKITFELSNQITKHDMLKSDHELLHKTLNILIESHDKDIKKSKKAENILYGVIITTALFISGGIIAYFIKM